MLIESLICIYDDFFLYRYVTTLRIFYFEVDWWKQLEILRIYNKIFIIIFVSFHTFLKETISHYLIICSADIHHYWLTICAHYMQRIMCYEKDKTRLCTTKNTNFESSTEQKKNKWSSKNNTIRKFRNAPKSMKRRTWEW